MRLETMQDQKAGLKRVLKKVGFGGERFLSG
jgi:hypothetical protein